MQRINNDIKSGQFQKIYLLCGEERYLRKQYKDKLKNALCAPDDNMNNHFYEGKNISVGEIIDLAETMPFLAERRVIFIEESGLFKAGGEQLAEYLTEVNESTVFVFSESEIDRRSKIFKTAQSKGSVVEFVTQDENTLSKWIVGMLGKEGKKITGNTLQLFMTKTGTDMENIHMELEKLICYCMDKEVIEAADVETICANRISNQIFDMVDALSNGKEREALQLYYDLIALKEPPMRILFLVAKHCNQLMQAKEMKNRRCDNKEIASAIGAPPFAVNKLLAQAQKFKAATLKEAVRKCVEAEEAVKTGRLNDTMSVELLLLSVLKAEQ